MPRRMVLFGLLIGLGVALWAGGDAWHASAQTPTPSVRLPGHVLGALAKATARAAAANAGSQPIRLTIVLKRADEPGFQAFLADIQNPRSPNFEHFLSQSALTARFGPTQAGYDAALRYLQQQGFSLVASSANRLTITVAGTRAQAEQAFGIQIRDYQLGGRSFYANDANPAVPAAVAPFVQAILGLDDLGVPQPRDAHAAPSAAPRDAPNTNPQAFAQAYDFAGVKTADGTAATGGGEKIGIVAFDNFFDADVATWLTTEKLDPTLAKHVTRKAVDGGTQPGKGEGEVLLDIDTLLGMAPGANLVVYDAPNGTSDADVFNAMLNDNVDVISNSWGSCESDTTQATAMATDTILAGAVASGITAFQAIGDHKDHCNAATGPIDPGFPDDDPNTTGVGGTNLQVTSTGAYQSESWWDNGTDGGGFGVSCCFTTDNPPATFSFPRPAYQNGFTTSATRSVPDVSADADPATGMTVCQADSGGCTCCAGGTSMAAPEWAAGMALINQALGKRVGNLNPMLYAAATSAGLHPPKNMQPSASGATNDFAHLGLGSFDLGSLFATIKAAATGAAPVSAANSTLTPPTQMGAADGTTAARITATLVDTNGNPVRDKSVSLAAGSGASTVTPPNGATSDSRGQVMFSVADATAETVTYTATDTTDNLVITPTASVTFAAPVQTVSGTNSLVDPANQAVLADGTSTGSIRVTLRDTNGQPVAGRTVGLTPDGGGSNVTAPNGTTTDAKGQVVFNVSDANPETVTYTAMDTTDAVTVTATGVVQFTAVAP